MRVIKLLSLCVLMSFVSVRPASAWFEFLDYLSGPGPFNGLEFDFHQGEGPIVVNPVRTVEDIARLDTTRTGELGYVAKAIEKVVAHFGDSRGIIGF